MASIDAEQPLRFKPSAVDGLDDVTEAALFPDRLELHTGEGPVVICFRDIAKWIGFRRHFYRCLARIGGSIIGWPSVADRDWFHPPSRRFFRFYTSPPITVFLQDEPRETRYHKTLFRRIQDTIAKGGFTTFDLG